MINSTFHQLQLDLSLQLRNGFYYAAAAAVVASVCVLIWLDVAMLVWLLPAVLFGNFIINGMMFMAGLILLERNEGTLQALAVSPLPVHQYLAGKLGSLTLLCLVESTIIAFVLRVPIVVLPTLFLGIVFGTVLMAVAGLLLAIRYRSINDLLMPAVAWAMVLQLPILPYFDIGDTWLAWLHPLHPALTLLESGFSPLPWSELALAVMLGTLWMTASIALAVRVTSHFMAADNPS